MPSSVFAETTLIAGQQKLWAETLGDPQICVAVLDGWVDRSHPCFKGANLTPLESLTSTISRHGSAAQHGTHVTSIIFGQHDGAVRGIAPQCQGLLIPIFTDAKAEALVKDPFSGTIAP